MADYDLGHYLKVRYGLPPGEPTEEQLRRIVADIQAFAKANEREPDADETGAIVQRHCPGYGTWKYAADVNLELRRQIALLARQANK